MDQFYLNRPSPGGAMTAEEFAASLLPPGGEGCPAPGGMVCCCRELPAPCPQPPAVEEGCCCKQSFRAALGLLCREEAAELLDFNAAAFITDDYAAGTPLTETVAATTPADNLAAPPTGIFRRFSPCSLDLLDISAPLTAVPATATGLTVTQANLCELIAVVIQLAATEAEGDLTAEQVADRNLRRVRRALTRQLSPCGSCAGNGCSCPVGEDCCCAAGLLSALADNNLSRRVSLAAGPLLLNGVTLLGHVGNVLVLVNEADLRFYFVCVNHIEFLA